jgi:sugar fermentation stimulation protein A
MGSRHLEDLAERAEAGDRAVLVFFVHRPDVDRFRPAWEIDPDYAEALGWAVARGVEVLPLSTVLTVRGVAVGSPIPYDLGQA